MTGAEALIRSLEKAGVDTVFGYPGGNVIDLFDHIATAKFKFVLARHEQGATHAADGYARATGRPGVVLVTSGPGATNAITGLATANMDGVPMVLISGQVSLKQIGTDAFQEADMSGICRGVTKHSFLVQSADEIPRTVAEAFYIATHGKPGTVVIDLPRNVQRELTKREYPKQVTLRAYHPECSATTEEIRKAIAYLNASKRPLIYAGGGVISSGASAELMRLVKRVQLPVVTTLMGIGAMDTTDEHCLGMAGVFGSYEANRAIVESDLILALGVRFNDRMTAAFPKHSGKKIIHVDCDPSSIEKNVPVDLGITADIREMLAAMMSGDKVMARKESWRIAVRREDDKQGGKLTNAAAIKAIARAVDEQAIIVADVGEHQMAAARWFPHRHARHFITSGGMGTMGFAIPAAIGVAIGKPKAKVVAIVGDGGAQMTAEELIVAVDEKLPIVWVVMNNRELGMIRRMQKKYFVGKFTNPDFRTLAKAYGVESKRVTTGTELTAAVKRAIKGGKPYLIEAMIEGGER